MSAALTWPASAQQAIDVRVNRWITVKQVSGDVDLLSADGARQAKVGDRLTMVGDGIRTGAMATSTLEVDTGIGTIQVRPNTVIEVRNLSLSPNDGRITHLYVPQGGVNLSLRRFTNRESELQIETPSGVSGVRGTEFGVTVQPDGATGVATRTGAVSAQAEAVEVTVQDGYQTLIRPGNAPLEPTLIPPLPLFEYQIDYVIRAGVRRYGLVGTINPINQAFIEGELQTLSPEGQFSYEVPAIRGAQVKVTVLTPLGDETEYDVALQ
ncbi:MAG: FecR domain-containing protein [Nodosilinea sp.]